MKKIKKLFVILLLAVVFTTTKVNAQEVYYTNDEGVEFTKEEYDFFGKFYYDGFQNYITQELKDSFQGFDFATAEVSKVGYCPNIKARGSYYETQYRSIEIGRSCGALCYLGTTVKWLVEPYTKSYDVIGYNLTGVSRISTPTTIVVGDGSGSGSEAVIYDDDGFGAVVKLPEAHDINITQTFAYTGTGYVMAAYDHALKPISLEDAKKFNIDIGGFSGIFDFYGPAVNTYDEYPAVDMTI